MPEMNGTLDVPPAGGTQNLKDMFAAIGQDATLLIRAREDIKTRALNVTEFSLKGGIVLGLATAGGYFARALWRGRNSHIAT